MIYSLAVVFCGVTCSDWESTSEMMNH